jgi:hypothetical protein
MIAPYFSYEINHGVLFSLGNSHMFVVFLLISRSRCHPDCCGHPPARELCKCFFMPTLLFYVFIPSAALFFSMVYSALFCPLLVDSNYAGFFCGSCTQSVRVYLPVVCMAVAAACQLVPTKGNLPLTIMYHGYHCCLLAILKRVL